MRLYRFLSRCGSASGLDTGNETFQESDLVCLCCSLLGLLLALCRLLTHHVSKLSYRIGRYTALCLGREWSSGGSASLLAKNLLEKLG